MLELIKDENVHVVKSSADCVVAEGADCFYKVRKIDASSPRCNFEFAVTQAYAQEYERLGIRWKLSCVNNANSIYLIEERQKLKVAAELDASFQDVLIRSYEVQRRVENRLEFPRLLTQIKATGKFDNVDKITLARNCEDDANDYAIWNGNVIALGESSRVLVLRDNFNGSWLNDHPTEIVKVKLNLGDFWFTSDELMETPCSIGGISREADTWWLFSNLNENTEAVVRNLERETKTMLASNLEMRVTNVPIPVITNNSFGSLDNEVKALASKTGVDVKEEP